MARQTSPTWRKGKRNSNDSLDTEPATDDVPARRAPAEQGRYRLLRKPFTVGELSETVREMLEVGKVVPEGSEAP